MMQINSKSWHYRLWRFGRESPSSKPRDLCRYFWHLALVKVLLPALLAAMVLIGIGTLAVIVWKNPIVTGIVLGSIIMAVAAFVGIMLFVKWRIKQNKRRYVGAAPSGEPRRKPNVLLAYLAARKHKVCPLIEVIND